MFFDNSQFPFTELLEKNWKDIYEELMRLKDGQFLDWPEKHLYSDGWSVFGLYSFGIKMDKNCAICPKTTALLEQIPGLMTGGFSHMKPGTHIAPHSGAPEGVLRCHLGLIVPENCAIRVGGEVRGWAQGKTMVFDDTFEHEAWNKSEESRVILLLDFESPLAQQPPKKKSLFSRLFSKKST